MGDLEDIKETPEEIAATFTCAMFETSQDVLKGARHMVHLSLFVTFFSSPFYPETAFF
jgi:transcription elongation factor SPT6